MPSIPNAAKTELTLLAELASKAAHTRLNLQTAFTRRIYDLCPSGQKAKLTTRLQEWWELPNFLAFRTEVKKVFKSDIPLADRSAWEDWMTRDRSEIGRLSTEIAQAEDKIDSLVYGLFDLTSEEIKLLEAVVFRKGSSYSSADAA